MLVRLASAYNCNCVHNKEVKKNVKLTKFEVTLESRPTASRNLYRYTMQNSKIAQILSRHYVSQVSTKVRSIKETSDFEAI